MSKFLDNTGLSRLVENIKNKFQPKPFLLELSVSYDRQTNEGSVSIREDDIARAFDHLYKYKDSSDYNISFKVYNSYWEATHICKANSIQFDDYGFTINIDYNLHVADDRDQDIGHIRLDLDRERVEGYYDEQNIVYDNSVLLTGTGVAPKKTHCKLFNDGGYWTIAINDNNEYKIIRDGAALYEVLKDKLDNLTFDIKFDNIYSLYDVNYNIRKDEDNSINIILTGLAYLTYDEPLTDIVKIGIWLGEGEEGDCIIYKVTDIEINNLNIINNLYKSGDGTKFLANDGSYYYTSKLITFEAENGSLNAEQTGAIEEGYLRNLPIYVLYSGIKMLVNGIQKLGDIYSLSCRHDNSTYSITMNLDDNSYEISSIRE